MGCGMYPYGNCTSAKGKRERGGRVLEVTGISRREGIGKGRREKEGEKGGGGGEGQHIVLMASIL